MCILLRNKADQMLAGPTRSVGLNTPFNRKHRSLRQFTESVNLRSKPPKVPNDLALAQGEVVLRGAFNEVYLITQTGGSQPSDVHTDFRARVVLV